MRSIWRQHHRLAEDGRHDLARHSGGRHARLQDGQDHELSPSGLRLRPTCWGSRAMAWSSASALQSRTGARRAGGGEDGAELGGRGDADDHGGGLQAAEREGERGLHRIGAGLGDDATDARQARAGGRRAPPAGRRGAGTGGPAGRSTAVGHRCPAAAISVRTPSATSRWSSRLSGSCIRSGWKRRARPERIVLAQAEMPIRANSPSSLRPLQALPQRGAFGPEQVGGASRTSSASALLQPEARRASCGPGLRRRRRRR